MSTAVEFGHEVMIYEAGNPAFLGLTTVEVKGDASACVRIERGDTAASYPLKLLPAELDQLRALLQANELASLGSARTTGVPPDDILVSVAWYAGKDRIEAEFWHSEQWSNPKLQALVSAFSNLASCASGGKASC